MSDKKRKSFRSRLTQYLKGETTPGVDPDVVREMAKLLEETGLSEIEVERGGVRVRVARERTGAQGTAAAAPAAPAAARGGRHRSQRRRRARAQARHHGDLADGRHRLSLARSPALRPSSMSATK